MLATSAFYWSYVEGNLGAGPVQPNYLHSKSPFQLFGFIISNSVHLDVVAVVNSVRKSISLLPPRVAREISTRKWASPSEASILRVEGTLTFRKWIIVGHIFRCHFGTFLPLADHSVPNSDIVTAFTYNHKERTQSPDPYSITHTHSP